jgi:FkbM family methyltransferase
MGFWEGLTERARFQAWWPLKAMARPSPSFYLSHSQFGEDMVLRALLDAEQGFYVDIGAFHPVHYSNTLYFYRKGWRGLNVDARPGAMAAFRRLRPRDVNVEACVGPEERDVTFFQFDHPAYDTIDEAAAEKARAAGANLLHTVPTRTVTLGQLLDLHLPAGQEVSFLSVDVEGMDTAILMAHDWSRHRPRAIVFEQHGVCFADAPGLPLVQRLAEQGYVLEAKCGPSLVLVRS